MRSLVTSRSRNVVAHVVRWGRAHPWTAASAVITGLGLGVGVGLPSSAGLFGISVMVLLVVMAIGIVFRWVTPQMHRREVGVLLALAFAVRIGAAAVIYFGSLHTGQGGFVSGDDRNYARLAWAIVLWARGTPAPPDIPPGWGGNDYLLGTFVYIQTALYWFFGPQLLVSEILNAGYACTFLVLLHDLTRRIMGPRPALLTARIFAVYPSLILWSALNLKDALALLIVGTIFWGLLRFQLRPHWAALAVVLLMIVPVESLRRYLYNGLAILVVIGVAITPRLRPPQRAIWVAAAVAGAAFLVSVGSRAGPGVPTGGLAGLEQTRYAMALGARTSFIDSRTVPATEGDTFVVVDPNEPVQQTLAASSPVAGSATEQPTPLATAAHVPTRLATPTATTPPAGPTRTPRVIVVAPGTRIVLASPAPAAPITATPVASAEATQAALPAPTAKPVVVVQPGDIVVVGRPGTTPAPPTSRRELVLYRDVPSGSAGEIAEGSGEALAFTRTLAYIPTGAAYALFAPFPWVIRRTLDLLTIPEMLFWYMVLLTLPWSIWRLRAQWPYVLPVVLYVVGLLAVFVLTEGNYGTLFRHRSMIIPFAVALVSPTLLVVWERARASVERRRAPARPRTTT